uniref:Growth-regulating factor n=1 Tax=Aegilops tauschii subsp. strangulata TaxID=200361 RepID=A0A453PA13_AEGTS
RLAAAAVQAAPPLLRRLERRYVQPHQESCKSAVTMAVSSPLGLGLGLGLGGDSRGEQQAFQARAAAAAAKSALTFMQQQELEHQVLIYRYFAAGAPVPVHLVLPIWKSIAASSFGPHRFPSLIGLGSLCFDYRSSMEPEPGRCRRTDGKKWRCSRDVLQGHKYCERHVHRGRGRSRKPVEGAPAAPAHTPPRAPPEADGLVPSPPRPSVRHGASAWGKFVQKRNPLGFCRVV